MATKEEEETFHFYVLLHPLPKEGTRKEEIRWAMLGWLAGWLLEMPMNGKKSQR